MKKTQITKKIATIKKRALDLSVDKQITRHHAYILLNADYDDELFIKFLISITEDLMRIKGYYRDNMRISNADKYLDSCIAEFNKRRITS